MSHWKPIYYPLRTTLPVGCLLFLMQLLAKLIRDVAIVIEGEDVFPVRVRAPLVACLSQTPDNPIDARCASPHAHPESCPCSPLAPNG